MKSLELTTYVQFAINTNCQVFLSNQIIDLDLLIPTKVDFCLLW